MNRFFVTAAILALALPAFAETRTYDVKGMTCGSCVKSVRKQICDLKGVASCNVEVGKVTLEGEGLSDDDVKAGIEKAGFKVVGVEHADATASADQKPAPGPTLDAHKMESKAAAKAKGGIKK